ncbi:hypothetical protein H6F96_06870 [Microcoleus sp. FACHB-53]|nr:hypothetical protein [Microcoleus sp. FACHB-53]MBD2128814.1 hypothetical protein [Microcoleus sp. FACHB-1]
MKADQSKLTTADEKLCSLSLCVTLTPVNLLGGVLLVLGELTTNNNA